MKKSPKSSKKSRNTIKKRNSKKIKSRKMNVKKMIGGKRYDARIIEGASQIFFGPDAAARFPLISVNYSKSGWVWGRGDSISKNLLTPGSIFKTTTIFKPEAEKLIKDMRNAFGPKATHTGLNILTGVGKNDKGQIISFTFLPIYFLPDPIPKDNDKERFITTVNNLKIIAEQQANTDFPETNVKVVTGTCSPGSLEFCNIGFETVSKNKKEDNKNSVDIKKQNNIEAKQQKVNLNGSRIGYSTNLEDLSVIGYDEIKFSPTIPDGSKRLEDRIQICKTYLKNYLKTVSDIKVSDYGLTQFCCLYNNENYTYEKEEETIAKNKAIVYPSKNNEVIKYQINELLNTKNSRVESNVITAEIKDQILAYIILFRLVNIPLYKFNLSKRELFFICNYIAETKREPGDEDRNLLKCTQDLMDEIKYGSVENKSAVVPPPTSAPMSKTKRSMQPAPAPRTAPAPDAEPDSEPDSNTSSNSEWEEKFSTTKQRKYWKNTQTGVMTWEDPTPKNPSP